MCGGGGGGKSLFAASVPHGQDGHHAHIIMVKTLQKSSSPEPVERFPRDSVCSIGDSGLS